MMKRISYILAAAAVMLTACQQKLEFLHDLTLSTSTVNMPAAESYHVIAVYSNADWTAAFSEPVDWASMDVTEGGDGIGRIRLDCIANNGLKRSVKVIVTSGAHADTLKVNQYSSVATPEFSFANSSVELSSEPSKAAVRLVSNLGEDVERAVVSVTYPDGNAAEWITGVEVTPNSVLFNVSRAESDRSAVLTLSLSDSDGKLYEASLNVIQNK